MQLPPDPGERAASTASAPFKVLLARGDLLIRERTLAAGAELPWHHHSAVFELYYGLEGEMQLDVIDAFTGKDAATRLIEPGVHACVDAGTAHRVMNRGPAPCKYLLIQGEGKYDFLPFTPPTSMP
jgi:mannose-6-phosphate isomerase-like protein (cupin superfamily)